jgi:hypothetical protein
MKEDLMLLPSKPKYNWLDQKVERVTTLSHSDNMHSIFSRINNVSAFLSSCMMALLAAIAISSFVFTANPHGDLAIDSIKVLVQTTSGRI